MTTLVESYQGRREVAECKAHPDKGQASASMMEVMTMAAMMMQFGVVVLLLVR